MNTRGEVLFGLTCTFDCYRPGRRDEQVLWESDLPGWIAFHSSNECNLRLPGGRLTTCVMGSPTPFD